MSKEMIITTSPQETKVAILEDDQLVEVHIERSKEQSLVGSIYKGRVTKVLPGMQSAFVNVGLERDAFLYVSDFFEESEELGGIVATEDETIEKLEAEAERESIRLSPAVIEIPTLPDLAAVSAVAPAPPRGLGAVAASAVTTQPPVVSEKAVETEEPRSIGATPAGQPGRTESDRQRGRYGRRRGRRRPWERRREERQQAAQQTSAPTPPPMAIPQSGTTPQPPVVIPRGGLTPLPGESLSKFQPATIAPVEEIQKPEAEEALSHMPDAATESADVIEVPAPPRDFEALPAHAEEVATTDVLDFAIAPAAPDPPRRTFFQTELRRPVEQRPAPIEAVPADRQATAEPRDLGAAAPATLGAIPAERPAETTESISASPAVEATAKGVVVGPLQVETSAILPTETIAPRLRGQVTETETVTAAVLLAAEAKPRQEIEPPATTSSAQESIVAAMEKSAATLEPAATPSFEHKSETCESFPAQEIRLQRTAELSPVESATPLTPSAAADSAELIERPEASVTAEATILRGGLPVTAPSPPQVKTPHSETVSPSPLINAPAVTVPVDPSTPEMPPAERRPVQDTKKGLDQRSGQARTFSRGRFREKRFEKRPEVPLGGPAPQPEVYGPPTPYEFMSGEEKAEYNPPRRTQEKAQAKIQDVSRGLTAPQSSAGDYRRGRRGRRGRKSAAADEGRGEQAETPRPRGGASRPLIADLLREGQEILVQIAKEPLGKKGARITSHIALPGRYLVYMPTVDHIGVSRKIGTDEERRRLKRVINEHRAGLSGGFIVRTAAEGRSEEELKQDIRFLANAWADIRSRAEKRPSPALLHRDLGVLERILRDQLSSEFNAIRIDSETEYAKVLEFVSQFQPALVNRVKLHLKDTPIFEEHGIHNEIDKALKPKVWLKSGGYIVINQTEAMVAIDVNTGKFVGKTTRLEDTIVKTNIDAAKEVARQVRLRDMGGIIVIDFIDMEERKNRQKVIQALEDAMRKDRAPSKILAFNDFGLVALTRKRVKQSLEKTLLQPCSYCQGHGMIKSIQTVCYEIESEARKMASTLDGKEVRIRVNPEVAKALKTSELSVISEIESHTRKDVVIKSDPQIHQDQYDIY